MPPTRSKVPGLHSDALPVGTVIDWYRKDAGTPIPEGWQWCDGGLISDARSSLNGVNTPDCRDKMTRGKADTSAGATSGGSDTKNLSHTHGGGSLQFRFAYFPGTGIGREMTFYKQDGTACRVFDGSGRAAGSDATNTVIWYYDTGNTRFWTENGQASGSTDSAGSGSQDVVPAYVGLIKLIKIF